MLTISLITVLILEIEQKYFAIFFFHCPLLDLGINGHQQICRPASLKAEV